MKNKEISFTRREEQIMDIIFKRNEVSVSDLMKYLPGSPTSGAVRRMLNLLHAKGAVEYRHEGAKKIYRAKIKKQEAGRKALTHVIDTFFAGSAVNTMGTLFKSTKLNLSDREKETLRKLLAKAKEKGR
jgi:predicted transcriptional regulator